MGVGFYLTGQYSCSDDGGFNSTEHWLDEVREWFESKAGEPLVGVRVGEDHSERSGVFVQLHVSAEEVEIVVHAPGRLIASGKTSTTGPGYHTYACDLLKNLGTDLSIVWDEPDEEEGTGDETGYFHTGDASEVEAEMLRWLRGTAAVVLKNLDEGYSGMMISMPMGHSYPGHSPLVTPMGTRDRAWQEMVAAEPHRGKDLFPWWSSGIGPDFYLGRALCTLWQDIRWRVPLTEDEAKLWMNTHMDLTRAFRLDASLSFPWREWLELLGYIESYFGYVENDGDDIEPEIRRRAALLDSLPLIGYRRQPVRANLTGRWSIEIPGSMAEEWDENGTWSAWDGQRTVWFTSFSIGEREGSQASAEQILADADLPEGEMMEFQKGPLVGRAVGHPFEEDGEKLWQLDGRCSVEGCLAVCNIFIKDLKDREWAIATWQSVQHP